MEYSIVVNKVRESRKLGRYLMINYNGTFRDVYPLSMRSGPGGMRLYAWCTLHPTEKAEAFLVSKMVYCEVSDTPVDFEPDGVEEI